MTLGESISRLFAICKRGSAVRILFAVAEVASVIAVCSKDNGLA
jgi:hypothetical protein